MGLLTGNVGPVAAALQLYTTKLNVLLFSKIYSQNTQNKSLQTTFSERTTLGMRDMKLHMSAFLEKAHGNDPVC